MVEMAPPGVVQKALRDLLTRDVEGSVLSGHEHTAVVVACVRLYQYEAREKKRDAARLTAENAGKADVVPISEDRKSVWIEGRELQVVDPAEQGA